MEGIHIVKFSDFQDQEVIGRGQFGEVSKVTYKGEKLVLKRLLRQQEEDRRVFLKESVIMKDLKHSNIVQLKGVCVEKCGLLMEYMAFDFHVFQCDEETVSSLEDFLHYIDRNNIVPQFDFAVLVALQIGNALQYMHQNSVAHRDLKPANVLVTNQHYASINDQHALQEAYGQQPIIVKLGDFGESRSRFQQTSSLCHTRTCNVNRGTPVYMDPELMTKNSVSLTDLIAADVWAFGLVMFMIMNPSLGHPFSRNLEKSSTGRKNKWADVRDNILSNGEKPIPAPAYLRKQSTCWLPVFNAYEECMKPVEQRGDVATVISILKESGNKPFTVHPLKYSQDDAIIQRDSEIAANLACGKSLMVPPPPPPANDGTNACCFLSLMISDDIFQDKGNLYTWDEVVLRAENIINFGPLQFNLMRDKEKYYAFDEAKTIMHNAGILKGMYELHEMVLTDETVFSPEGRHRLEDSLAKFNTRLTVALYACGPYVFTIGCLDKVFFVIDTHQIPVSLGGNGHGLLVTFRNPIDTCTWIWKRLDLSGVAITEGQSLCILKEIHR